MFAPVLEAPESAAELAPLREQLRAIVRQHVQALRFDPDNAAIWHNLGNTLALLGDCAGALTALRNALLLDGARTDTQPRLAGAAVLIAAPVATAMYVATT
ncbi:MAG TPA: tetratricopeptide repeat protein [Steroidobacteraceae bacterium]|nr:tetratricopeptide repeat protein [Steroidobacteraceae bacterium]